MSVRSDVRPEPEAQTAALHRRALGVPDLVFFIVAASAPLTAVAGGQAVSFLVTGNQGIPFLFIPLGILLIVFASGYAAMSHHMATAGAFYAYVAQGLGKVAGVGTAFVALVAYNAMQIGIYGLFGVAFGAFMSAELGLDLEWWGWCLLAWAVIAVLGVLQIDLNAKVLALLLIAETVIVVLFDVAVAADPGPEGLSLVPFDPGVALGTALGAALAFNVASFVGFESAALYSEECRDPRRTVARATFIAVALVAICYALSSWLLANSIGPSAIVDPAALVAAGYAAGDAPDPTVVLIGEGTARLGALWGDAAALLFATSLFAALISFHNAVARYVFSLGREGILPRVFGRVNRATGAPWIGSVAQSTLAVAVLAVFALAGEDPVLSLFTWLTSLGALGVVLLLAVASFAVVAFFRRNPEFGEGAWSRSVAPALAAVGLSAIFVVGLANFNVLITSSTEAPRDPKAIILPAIVVGAGVLGLLLGLVLRARSPRIYAGIGEGGAGHPS